MSITDSCINISLLLPEIAEGLFAVVEPRRSYGDAFIQLLQQNAAHSVHRVEV